jgi:D-aspartate ligase
MEFGRASTFVETVEDADVRSLGRRVIARLGHTGLVEVEFMRDPRTNETKLLDINPRLWGWHTIGRRAGLDFAFQLYRLVCGHRPEEREGAPGVRWMWPVADVPTAAREILHGNLRLVDYIQSFQGPIDFATLRMDDPLPGLLELPLQGATALQRVISRSPVARRRGPLPVATPSHNPNHVLRNVAVEQFPRDATDQRRAAPDERTQ